MHKAQEWLFSHNRYGKLSDNFHQHEKKLQGKAITLAITGGKGGVGKTSIALKMAISLSNEGHKVLLLDCDSNLSNTLVKLGLPLDDRFARLYQGKIEAEEVLVKKGNLHILPGCNGDEQLLDGDHRIEKLILGIMAKMEYRYDFIILDTPAGIKKEMMEICAYCDQRVFVVTPDRSSITDSYSLIKILKNNYGVGHNCLLLNRIREQKQFNRLVKCLTDTVDQFLSGTLTVLGKVSEFDCAPEHFDKQFLTWEKNSSPQEFDKILARLVDEVCASTVNPVEQPIGKVTNIIHADLSI